jgi:hypothetical protein
MKLRLETMKRITQVWFGIAAVLPFVSDARATVTQQCHWEERGTSDVDANGTPTYTTTDTLVCDGNTVGSPDPSPTGTGNGGNYGGDHNGNHNDSSPPTYCPATNRTCQNQCMQAVNDLRNSTTCQDRGENRRSSCTRDETNIRWTFCKMKNQVDPNNIPPSYYSQHVDECFVEHDAVDGTDGGAGTGRRGSNGRVFMGDTACRRLLANELTIERSEPCADELIGAYGDLFDRYKVEFAGFSLEGNGWGLQSVDKMCNNEASQAAANCRQGIDDLEACCKGEKTPYQCGN